MSREAHLGRRPALQGEAAVQPAAGSDGGDLFAWGERRRAGPIDEIEREVEQVVETMNRNPEFIRHVAQFKGTTLVLSATDTGRELMIVLDGRGARVGPFEGGPFDAKIRATEQVHWAVLSGRMDADAAFFAGKVRISGSILTAFRVKNRFLSLLQGHLIRLWEGAGESVANEP